MSKTASTFRLLLPAFALLAGCQLVSPIHPSGATLVIAPRMPRHVQSVTGAYGLASIDHLTIALYDASSGSPVLAQSSELPGAQIPTCDVSFSNLKQNTPYKIQAIAYASADSSTPISVDASSTVALETARDDAPTLGSVPVVLKDRVFNGSGSFQGVAIQTGACLPVGVVSTLAGSTGSGLADGSGSSARFSWPQGLAVDASGTVYVADGNNNAIREITPAGVVTTLAGGTQGSADGTGAAAQFNLPAGLAVDASGTVFVADCNNDAVRRITPAGVVTTLATFPSGPDDVVLDASGTVYVSLFDQNQIDAISPAGDVSPFVGSPTAGLADGSGSQAAFNQPAGLALDASGNLYVADYGNDAIRKITPAGIVTTLAGSGAPGTVDGTGQAASFHSPNALAVDASGDVFVVGVDSNEVRQITPSGVVTTLAGTASAGSADGTGSAAGFSMPCGIALIAGGVLVVSDAGNNEIREVK